MGSVRRQGAERGPDLGARLLGRRSRSQTPEGEHRLLGPVGEELRMVALPLRHPDIGPLAFREAQEGIGQDAHHGARPGPRGQGPAHHAGVGAEVAAPHARGEDHHVFAPPRVFVRAEGPSHQGMLADQVEVRHVGTLGPGQAFRLDESQAAPVGKGKGPEEQRVGEGEDRSRPRDADGQAGDHRHRPPRVLDPPADAGDQAHGRRPMQCPRRR